MLSKLEASSGSRKGPPEAAGWKWGGRDEGCKCQLNILSENCILAQIIITFLSFSVHLQAIFIRAACLCLLRNCKFAEQCDLKSQKHLNASNNVAGKNPRLNWKFSIC